MLKKVISILLIIIISFQFSLKTGIVGYFFLHKEYIASVLCINKNQPELNCRGICQLKKQLKKTEENEAKIPFTSLKDLTETFIFKEEIVSVSKIIGEEIEKNSIYYFCNYLSTNIAPPFRPPCA